MSPSSAGRDERAAAFPGRVTIHESELISVWCYPERGIIHHQMHGFCYRDTFRKALEAGTAALQKYRADSWLSDDRANSAISPEDEEWGNSVWARRTRAYGWKYWAMVRPVRAVGQLNVARLVESHRKDGVTTEVFTDPHSAYRWLDRVRAK